MSRAYIVRGVCGEYSDHREWEVAAFSTQSKADALAQRLNAWCLSMGCHASQGRMSSTVVKGVDGKKPPEDPAFEWEYNGTDYVVWDIEVEP